jgi:hypothetical protein
LETLTDSYCGFFDNTMKDQDTTDALIRSGAAAGAIVQAAQSCNLLHERRLCASRTHRVAFDSARALVNNKNFITRTVESALDYLRNTSGRNSSVGHGM